MKYHRLLCLILTAGLLAGGCRREPYTSKTSTAIDTSATTVTASATTTGITGGTVSAMHPDDKEFVIKTAQDGLAEVSLGEMATRKASNSAVKAFGSRMVDDHKRINGELNQLATLKGLAMPTESSQDQKDAAQRLEALSGSAFDKEYMKHMVEAHSKAVADFDKASSQSHDADLKTWTAKTLLSLKDYLRQATDTFTKLK